MRLIPLGTIVTLCQQRCDLEGDPHVSEWKPLISEMYAELCAVADETGMRFHESTSTVNADGVNSTFALPADLMSLIGVDQVLDSSGRLRQLDEAMVQERSRWSGMTGSARMYAQVGQNLQLWPTPPAGETYKLLYIPQPTDLSAAADNTNVDVITPDGQGFLIWGVAVKALAKSETDVTLAIQEREAARARFTEWCVLRAFNNPRRRIVRNGDGSDMWDDGPLTEGDWRFR